MAEKERIGKAILTTCNIQNGGVLIDDFPLIDGGSLRMSSGAVSVTGAGAVTTGLGSITAVTVSLNQAPSASAASVTATWAGNVITISVWTSADAASTVAANVSYVATGNGPGAGYNVDGQ